MRETSPQKGAAPAAETGGHGGNADEEAAPTVPLPSALGKGRAFTMVPDWLMATRGLSHGAKLTWARLQRYAGQSATAFPSTVRLASDLGVSRYRVFDYIKELEHLGLLETTRRDGRTSVYKPVADVQPVANPQPVADTHGTSGESATDAVADVPPVRERQLRDTARQRSLPADCLALTDELIAHVTRTRDINVTGAKRGKWAEEVDKLERLDGVDYARQRRVLEWYVAQESSQYLVVVECGSTWREKFTRVEGAMQREASADTADDTTVRPTRSPLPLNGERGDRA